MSKEEIGIIVIAIAVSCFILYVLGGTLLGLKLPGLNDPNGISEEQKRMNNRYKD